MKAKLVILLIVSCAVITLSFTVSSRSKHAESRVQPVDQSGPAGGMISEDPIR